MAALEFGTGIWAFGQFVAFLQEHVGASHFGKVVQGADADDAAADDDNFYALTHV